MKINNLDGSWLNCCNIPTDDGNHPFESYIEGAAKFQQRAIEELKRESVFYKNNDEDQFYNDIASGIELSIKIIKNLKTK